MGARDVTYADLARDPESVARGLLAWQRGDRDEAVVQTLRACGRELHGRTHPLWVWRAVNDGGDEVWILPVTAREVGNFAPRGPAAVLLRVLSAAIDAGAVAEGVRALDWHGLCALELPGADGELAALAIAERDPAADPVRVADLPAGLLGAPAEIGLEPTRRRGDALQGLALDVDAHPLEVALTLAEHGQPLDAPAYPAGMAANLRAWGLEGAPPPPETRRSGPPGIADDPCPRRRHARRVLQRLLRMGKVGTNYHTAVDHLYRGAPADQRREALEVGEALIRAGLLGEKPSVGQRHVYLRREALPAIHALIERGETDDAGLAALWTAPPPAG